MVYSGVCIGCMLYKVMKGIGMKRVKLDGVESGMIIGGVIGAARSRAAINMLLGIEYEWSEYCTEPLELEFSDGTVRDLSELIAELVG